MMTARDKVISTAEAAALLHDGDVLVCSGFGSCGVPEALALAVAERFAAEGKPQHLTLIFGGGPGDGSERGLNCLGREGLLARVIGGHYGLVPRIGALAVENRVAAYNMPLGVISRALRDLAAGMPGHLSKVGLGTFVDPRLEGGKINALAAEDLVRRIEIDGTELLYYRLPRPQVAFIRATTADREGNLTMEREPLTQDVLPIAMAAKNAGGLVIAQVERIAERGSLHPKRVKVPGVLVDGVVVATPERHPQTFGTPYSPAYAAEIRVPLDSVPPLPLDERKVIARRAAMELQANAVINLGIGMPEGVASVANEERILRHITLTAESGVIGGVPASGLDFGSAACPDAIIDMNQQFDFYDGGGLDLAILGMAECDAHGHVNVSRFGAKLAGAGGFIDITQNARRVVFVGTFTACGLKVRASGGRLAIEREGSSRKFVQRVRQVTFSGTQAAGRDVLYVTERCVFRLTAQGVELIEVAPGVDVERDVLAKMDFRPRVDRVRTMDPAIFTDAPMQLKDRLLAIALANRISFDADRNTLFYNFENLKVRSERDVDDIRAVVEARCRQIGRKVNVVVNYDGFELAEDLADRYSAMVEYLVSNYYLDVKRYTTSAFMRLRLGEVLARRGVAPHIYAPQAELRTCEPIAHSVR